MARRNGKSGMHIEYKPRTKGQRKETARRYREKVKRERALSGPVKAYVDPNRIEKTRRGTGG